MVHQHILLTFFCSLVGLTAANSQNALIIGHRGASYVYPENTTLSAVKAWEEGADAVEIDVYPTADGKIAVLHDRTTKRTTGADYKVSETSSDVLTKLDAGKWKAPQFEGERLPLLTDILEVIPRYKKLVVEVKSGSEIVPILKSLLEDHPKRSQIIFIAFGWEVINDLKNEFPDLPCFWLSSKKADVAARWESVKSNGLDGINLHHSIIDQDLINQAHKDDLGILCWTVNKVEDARRLAHMGIDGITTDRPGYIRKHLLSDMDFERKTN
ncbi:hypothetical protein KUV50_03140 [Membranicola marinus]|uniref:GP-PDE domain-containing protein n=1 Tax=Membranihabitans marinus TaxID=1227546 RepID=A0A953L9Z0_9BACT|nr:glycerophosphodiester phosphodiesterase family protein [Membranihabitans marinus]MBY5957116.1 hypothetical protein [Membranihabitans marinus]